MTKPIKTTASGSTGLADALTAALQRKEIYAPVGFIERGTAHGKPVQTQNLPRTPNPLLERRRREENNNRIRKHAAIIKREDPRLYVEALQQFGLDLEGLNADKQEAFIKVLEGIRRDYRI